MQIGRITELSFVIEEFGDPFDDRQSNKHPGQA